MAAGPQNITSSEVARKIMGDNFIGLDEVQKIFPSPKVPTDIYEVIPFGPEILYWCSEPNNQFVLAPGLPRYGVKENPLTIVEIRKRFQLKMPELFAPCQALEVRDGMSNFANDRTCLPDWYLISKNVIDSETIGKFFKKMEINRDSAGRSPWIAETAVVYVYAWLLFKLLRGVEIFSEIPILCEDMYGDGKANRVYVQFINEKIVIAKSIPMYGYAPSISRFIK